MVVAISGEEYRQFADPAGVFASMTPELFGTLVSTTSDVAFVLDAKHRILDIAFGEEDDLPRDEMSAWVGKTLEDTITIESQSKLKNLFAEASPNGFTRWRQVNHVFAGQPDLPIRYAAAQLADGERYMFVGRNLRAVADLQQRLMLAQHAMERDYSRLRQAESRYRMLFHTTREAVVIIDAESEQILDVNPAARRLLTKGKEEPGGREILSFCSRNDRGSLQALLALVRAGGRGNSLKVKMDGRGGDSTELIVSASLFQQEQANCILLRLSLADNERTESSDAANTRQLPQIIEQMPDGFVVTDADLRVIAANAAFIQLIQAASPEQVRDAPLEQWIGRNETDASILLKNLKEIGSIKSYSTMVRGAYGMTEPVEISAVSVPGEDQDMIGFSIRSTFGRASAQQVIANHALPTSIEQLTDLVGQVSLKELVREATDVVERLCIEAALQLTKNNRASAAEMLGLSRQSLYSKMHRYSLGNLQNSDN